MDYGETISFKMFASTNLIVILFVPTSSSFPSKISLFTAKDFSGKSIKKEYVMTVGTYSLCRFSELRLSIYQRQQCLFVKVF